jgi:hypothetical protein
MLERSASRRSSLSQGQESTGIPNYLSDYRTALSRARTLSLCLQHKEDQAGVQAISHESEAENFQTVITFLVYSHSIFEVKLKLKELREVLTLAERTSFRLIYCGGID